MPRGAGDCVSRRLGASEQSSKHRVLCSGGELAPERPAAAAAAAAVGVKGGKGRDLAALPRAPPDRLRDSDVDRDTRRARLLSGAATRAPRSVSRPPRAAAMASFFNFSRCAARGLRRPDTGRAPRRADTRRPTRHPPTRRRPALTPRSRAGTVRAVKPVPGGSKGLTLKAHIEQALGAGTIEAAVRLPRGEDPSEWVAVNLVLLYNALSVLYHVLDDTLCTPACCPAMTAGPTTEYLWADGARGRAPARLAAPDYVNALFDWAEAQLDDPGLFPRGVGAAFPREFPAVSARRCFRLL
jgi:hypothetical protein